MTSVLERVKNFMAFAPYDGFRSLSGRGPDLEMHDLRALIALAEAALPLQAKGFYVSKSMLNTTGFQALDAALRAVTEETK